MTLTDLLTNKLYLYRVYSIDSFGNMTHSSNYLFRTTKLMPETDCFDAFDNDLDGKTDCLDSDCAEVIGAQTTCGVGECAGNTGRLICQGGVQVDTCDPLEGAEPENCDEVSDNDCDGLIGINDPECQECTAGEIRLCPVQYGVCSGSEEICIDYQWAGCDYAVITTYEAVELSCSDNFDNDCDGFTDCYDPDCVIICEGTMYEDAEDGLTYRWSIYDNIPIGAMIENVYDNDRESQVIKFTGDGTNNGYQLMGANGSRWKNRSQVVLEWSMRYTEDFWVYIDLETSVGHRYLTYRPVNTSQLGEGEYVLYGLGTGAMDGQWHTFVRDLQADLNVAQPGVTILEVNGFLIRGNGMVDDIRMLNEMP
jgi:hypothetical protein